MYWGWRVNSQRQRVREGEGWERFTEGLVFAPQIHGSRRLRSHG